MRFTLLSTFYDFGGALRFFVAPDAENNRATNASDDQNKGADYSCDF